MAATREETGRAPVSATTGAAYAKLSPGPGKPAGDVAAHQRARFHSAMVELIAERGYANIAVRDLAERAKVSSRAFYERFRGKEDCFLRTHELVVRRTAKRVVAAQAGERDRHERLRLGFKAFIRELDREPRAVRLALLDAYFDGPAARAQARKAELLFGAMLTESLGDPAGDAPGLSLAVEAIVAGSVEVARRQLLSGEERASPHLADELLDWALACHQRAAASPSPPFPIPSSKPATARSRSGTSDRDLCLAAVSKLAVSEGYAYLTVPRIRAAAGISRQRFDAEFGGVDDCLATAREERLERALERVRHGRQSSPVMALCDRFAEDPILASLCFAIDCRAPRPPLEEAEWEQRAVDRVAELLYGPTAGKPTSVPVQAGAGMVWAMLGLRALSGRPQALPRLAPELAALASRRAGRLVSANRNSMRKEVGYVQEKPA